jgi:hypothetical protein
MLTEYYKSQLESGLFYQDFVVEKLYDHGLPLINYGSKEYQKIIGENKAGFEIKYDKMFRKTGNFWIEIAEKSNPNNPNYVESGIMRKDNSWLYIIGDLKEIYVFSKKQLQKTVPKFQVIENNMKTSRGILLPLAFAEQYLILLKIKTEKE